jgi:hypothetical protein
MKGGVGRGWLDTRYKDVEGIWTQKEKVPEGILRNEWVFKKGVPQSLERDYSVPNSGRLSVHLCD